MSREKRFAWFSYALLALALVALSAGISSAQTNDEPNDTYRLNYYSNAVTDGAPDGTVHIVNPGTAVTKLNADGKPLNGDLCADIYVLNNDQQEVECCGCVLTPDSERTLSINHNLLGNPDNVRNVTTDGVIKMVSTAPDAAGKCHPDSEGANPRLELRAWSTHIQAPKTGAYVETEEEFSYAPLSDFEFQNLTQQCSAIFTSGSKHGICSCGYGD